MIMTEDICYRLMCEDEIPETSMLVSRVFNRFIAPLFPEEGIREFRAYIRPDAFHRRVLDGSITYIAEHDGVIIGAIHVRSCSHVSLLFVHEKWQGHGIAHELFSRALAHCLEQAPGTGRMTVNSSPKSVQFYQRLGFTETGHEERRNGIRFIPMELNLERLAKQ